MTKVKGRLTEWIEATVRALAVPAEPVPATEAAPSHVRVAERGTQVAARHTSVRRSGDARGHRSRRTR